MQTTIRNPFSLAISSGSCNTSSVVLLLALYSNEMEKSFNGSCPKLIFGTNLLRNTFAFSIHSSQRLEVARTTAVAKAFTKSFSERQPKASIRAILMFSLSTSEHTLSTSDVLPIRRGDIRIVFTPYMKLAFKRSVSSLRSVKVSPSPRMPNTKGASKLFAITLKF